MGLFPMLRRCKVFPFFSPSLCFHIDMRSAHSDSDGNRSKIFYSTLTPKNLKLCRPTLANYIFTRDEFAAYCDDLLALVEKHEISVDIYDVYPLKDAARAHQVPRSIIISLFSLSIKQHPFTFPHCPVLCP